MIQPATRFKMMMFDSVMREISDLETPRIDTAMTAGRSTTSSFVVSPLFPNRWHRQRIPAKHVLLRTSQFRVNALKCRHSIFPLQQWSRIVRHYSDSENETSESNSDSPDIIITTSSPTRRTLTPRAEMVNASVEFKVEAPPEHCYELFSDLGLMPNWSTTLQSVERDRDDPTLSTWKFSWSGISLSWRAQDVDAEPDDDAEPYVVRWKSISGLRHFGRVAFVPVTDQNKSDATPYTCINFSVDYDVASLVAIVMQSSMFKSFVERAVTYDLQRFRSYALRMYRSRRRPTNV